MGFKVDLKDEFFNSFVGVDKNVILYVVNNLTPEQMRGISVCMRDDNVAIVNLDESGYHHNEYILIRRSFSNSSIRYICYEPNQYPPLHEQPVR